MEYYNAIIGEKKKCEFSLGNYGYGICNERGNRLIEFVECEWMYNMNSFFKIKSHRKQAWHSRNGSTSKFNYILTNKKHIIQNCHVLCNFHTESDQKIVRFKLLLNTKLERMKLSRYYKYAEI